MNELIELADHTHNILTGIITKYKEGIQLTEQEEDVLSEMRLSRENHYMKTLSEIPYKYDENKFIPKKLKNDKPRNLQSVESPKQ